MWYSRPLLQQLLGRPTSYFRSPTPICLSPFAAVRTTAPRRLRPAARHNSTSHLDTIPSAPTTSRAPVDGGKQPTYELAFSCKPCSERSSHIISKQGYHSGTVLVQCPKCKSRHIISDHLKIFYDTSVTIEDIMREKGQMVRKIRSGKEGDVEFWGDAMVGKES